MNKWHKPKQNTKPERTHDTIGEQIGVITYPIGGTARSPFVAHHVNEQRAEGRVVVFDSGFARIHKAS